VTEGRPNVDMSMNMPPEPESPELMELMQSGWSKVNGRLRDLMRYQDFGGSPRIAKPVRSGCAGARCWWNRNGCW
jgi:hypothetical protein